VALSLLKRIAASALAAESSGPDTPETESVRRIVATLEALPPEQARYVAAFAYILGRVARADLRISDAETRRMEAIVERIAGLGTAQAVLVVQIARAQATLFGATENYLVTREFDRVATREQKVALLSCLFAVAAEEDSVSVVEDNEIRRISIELHLTHGDFIAARSAFRDALAVLRRPRA
jgi:uncharacterized tellurite resistance protein B-like protein